MTQHENQIKQLEFVLTRAENQVILIKAEIQRLKDESFVSESVIDDTGQICGKVVDNESISPQQ